MVQTKYLLTAVLIALLFVTSCQQEKSKEEQLKDFDWISGDWRRTNEQPGKETFEYWSKESDKLYTGMACTLQAGDTTFRENLKILRRKGAWYLDVTGTDEKTVSFQIMSVREKGLSAENPDHEFPKYIKYGLKGGQLEASIADDNNEIEFIYQKIN